MQIRKKRQTWTKERIIEEILKRRKRRRGLHSYRMMREDPKLYRAARHHFGSWRAAVEAAGLDYEKFRRGDDSNNLPKGYWSPEKVIKEMIKISKDGKIPGVKEAILYHSKLKAAAEYYFGSWHKARLNAMAYLAEKEKESPPH